MTQGLHPAFAALLSDPRVALRKPGPGQPLSELRAAANAFMARAPLPEVHNRADHRIRTQSGELTLRLIRPFDTEALPLILFLHGGGFVMGNLDSHESMARHLALSAKAAVAAVDYRLAPEHPFPAALEDAGLALSWLAENERRLAIDSTRIALAGDSAGSHLALSLALGRELPVEPRHLGLFYPMLDTDRETGSRRSLDRDYMLTGEFIDWAWDSYAIPGGRMESHLLSAELSCLPQTTVVTASHDPLRDEGLKLVERAQSAGVDVAHRNFAGMIHGFAGFPHIVDEAGQALAWMGARLGYSLSA